MTISLSFHGGAETVTGSRFLVEASTDSILIDCGLFQGLKPLRLMNWERSRFDVRALKAVLLTHAHIDHSGFLPCLVREGVRGPIYCTRPTMELAEILLLDSAKLNEEDADYANRKGYSKHHPALPLFTADDARNALALFHPARFGKWLKLGAFRARFHRAGHILGVAFIELQAMEGALTTTVVFSGDLGRPSQPLHPHPDPLPECDTLVLESTYGDRSHDSLAASAAAVTAIRRTLEREAVQSSFRLSPWHALNWSCSSYNA